jgi:hypothetical protein
VTPHVWVCVANPSLQFERDLGVHCCPIGGGLLNCPADLGYGHSIVFTSGQGAVVTATLNRAAVATRRFQKRHRYANWQRILGTRCPNPRC